MLKYTLGTLKSVKYLPNPPNMGEKSYFLNLYIDNSDFERKIMSVTNFSIKTVLLLDYLKKNIEIS